MVAAPLARNHSRLADAQLGIDVTWDLPKSPYGSEVMITIALPCFGDASSDSPSLLGVVAVDLVPTSPRTHIRPRAIHGPSRSHEQARHATGASVGICVHTHTGTHKHTHTEIARSRTHQQARTSTCAPTIPFSSAITWVPAFLLRWFTPAHRRYGWACCAPNATVMHPFQQRARAQGSGLCLGFCQTTFSPSRWVQPESYSVQLHAMPSQYCLLGSNSESTRRRSSYPSGQTDHDTRVELVHTGVAEARG
jgi:hypothetical protein